MTPSLALPAPAHPPLPLFLLHAVLFPGGVLNLRVFEARYVDLVSACLRTGATFGVVALKRGSEVREPGVVPTFERIGCEARVLEVDAGGAGVLRVRCAGARRFEVQASREGANGLIEAEVAWIEPDPVVLPGVAMVATGTALAQAIAALEARREAAVLTPHRFGEAGWIANRWAELLPITQTARQGLMELADPQMRLAIVDQFLRRRGIL